MPKILVKAGFGSQLATASLYRKKINLDMVQGNVCTKFQVSVVFRLARGREKEGTTPSKNMNILYRLLASR